MRATQLALIAFPKYHRYAELAQSSEAALLGAAFAARGARLDVVNGLDASVDWSRYDAVLPLGCWGYHKDAQGFREFIAALAGRGVRLINPPDMLLWNLDKSYLLDLRAAGVEVATLLHFPAGSRPDLGRELERVGWDRYVLKPAISANSERTRVGQGAPGPDMLALADEILARCGLLIQPFFDEIPQSGEWSLLFFGDQLSHSVVKVPKAGDFRSQPDHGGVVSGVVPSAAVIEQAANAVRAAARCVRSQATYARVDGFVRDGRLHLVELELIEPCLFLKSADGAAPSRFCDAVLAAIQA